MLTDTAGEILRTEWEGIRFLAESKKLKDWLDDPQLLKAVKLSINGSTKTYRYVLPTQLLSKLADPSLDSRCIQMSRGGAGAFDARTVAHGVIVPFDQENENVLGGSQEPYVSNPLRVAEVSLSYRGPQRDKTGWDQLCVVLNAVEGRKDESFAKLAFRQVLTEIYRRLSTVRVIYGLPRRVSLRRTIGAVQDFLSEQSGGDRLLALSCALFTIIGNRFALYEQVKRGKITAADQPSGMLADLECTTKEGRIVFAVEVKDRQITISQLKAKLRTIREKQVSEIFFIAQGSLPSEDSEVQSLIDREFASGQNIYITDLVKLCSTLLSIVGEDGRREFLAETANQLEAYKSEISHRKAWSAVLAKL
ncbi:MAG: restriction endonuclease, SacI family [Terriglobales bacterium]